MRTIIPILFTATLALAGCGRAKYDVVVIPETIDAQTALDSALAKAAVEDKVVFVHFSTPG